MENFVVSARKYRPQGFEEVVGQGHITTTLKNAIDNNQLAQALLFCGPRGVGKTTCARILARLINEFESEGPLENLSTLNIYELDAASNNSVEDIRNLIDQVRYPPQQGKYKVYIIDEVHMLSNQAFNAFLKTLEEPPSYAIFILATTEKHKVIPTILSRCQIYDFNRIEISDISDQLRKIAEKEGIEYEEEALHLMAQKADGAMRDALSIFDLIVTFSSDHKITYKDTISNLHILDHDYYFRITDLLLEEKLPETIMVFDEILKEGFDGHNFLVGLSDHLRDLMVCKDEITVPLLQVADSVKEKYKQQASAAPLSFLLSGLNILNQCDLNYKTSKNQRLHVELALMKLAHLNSALSIADIPSNPGEEKKKTSLESKKEEVAPSRESNSAGSVISPASTPQSGEKAGKETQSTTRLDAEKISDPVEGVFVEGDESKPVREPKDNPQPVEVEPVGSSRVPQSNRDDKQAQVKHTPSLSLDLAEEVEQGEEEEELIGEDDFSEAQLHELWEAYFEKKKGVMSGIEYSILKKLPTLQKGHILDIAIKNGVEINILKKHEEELLTHLRKELNNSLISINHVQEEVKEEENLYTDMDKFNDMAKRNPVLLKLKDRLGLDPEY